MRRKRSATEAGAEVVSGTNTKTDAKGDGKMSVRKRESRIERKGCKPGASIFARKRDQASSIGRIKRKFKKEGLKASFVDVGHKSALKASRSRLGGIINEESIRRGRKGGFGRELEARKESKTLL